MSETINATEAAAKLADENGIDLSAVAGTGADGRITKADVEALLAQPDTSALEAAPADPATERAHALAADVTAYLRDDPAATEIMALPTLRAVIGWAGDREKYQAALQARAKELLGRA